MLGGSVDLGRVVYRVDGNVVTLAGNWEACFPPMPNPAPRPPTREDAALFEAGVSVHRLLAQGTALHIVVDDRVRCQPAR